MKRHSVAGIVLAAMTVGAFATEALATNPTLVQVDLWNKADGSQGLTLSTDHAKSGKVEFKVKNSSTSMVHEFLIWKTDLAFEQFPKDPDNPAKVDEDKLKGVKELSSDLDPGKSGKLTMNLTPGRYVVFCNQPGHFDAGMHLTFTVTK